jgi:hypothetical protein
MLKINFKVDFKMTAPNGLIFVDKKSIFSVKISFNTENSIMLVDLSSVFSTI